MRLLRLALLPVLGLSIAVLAKDEPRITIQVVGSETSQRQFSHTFPGKEGTTATNCRTRESARGSKTETGPGSVQTQSSSSSSTTCISATTGGEAPQVMTHRVRQEQIYVVLPDGRQTTLSCQQGFRRCESLPPGKYEAEIDGNSMVVIVRDLAGKERKVKYRAGTVTGTATVPPPVPAAAPSTAGPN